MANNTAIEWTDATWNPVRGCSRVSEGCRNCYAERVASRFSGPGMPYEGLAANGKWTGKTRLVESALDQPLRWKAPRRIFVNSMSDLFHESLSNEDIAAVFGVMAAAPQHTFQVLTKRPKRMLEWFGWIGATMPSVHPLGAARGVRWYAWGHPGCQRESSIERTVSPSWSGTMPDWKWPVPNVWLGVSVENQAAADERIPLLLQTPAVVHFLSCEPLLGAVDLSKLLGMGVACSCVEEKHEPGGRCGDGWIRCNPGTRRVRWVIAGGESGHGARPMHPAWARSLRDQCAEAGVPFFFKQHGEWAPELDNGIPESIRAGREHGEIVGTTVVCSTNKKSEGERGWLAFSDDRVERMHRVGKRAAGRLLDGREHSEFPEVHHA